MRAVFALTVGCAVTGLSSAGYTLNASLLGSEGQSFLPGELFQVEVSLDSDAGDAHNSSLFSLIFTECGLLYEGYTWSSPYENETVFDFSSPLYTELPAVIDADSAPGPLTEIVLSNVVPDGAFESGTVVVLDLRVPDDWSFEGTVFALPQADTVASGFEEIEVQNGPAIGIPIIPAPASIMALCIFASAARVRCSREPKASDRCGNAGALNEEAQL